MNIFNPYSYVGAGLVVLGIGGSLYYQSTQIHHYHKMYDDEHAKVIQRDVTIQQMRNAQKSQLTTTAKNVIEVTTPTPIVKVIQDMKKEPLPANCATPTIPDELENYL